MTFEQMLAQCKPKVQVHMDRSKYPHPYLNGLTIVCNDVAKMKTDRHNILGTLENPDCLPQLLTLHFGQKTITYDFHMSYPEYLKLEPKQNPIYGDEIPYEMVDGLELFETDPPAMRQDLAEDSPYFRIVNSTSRLGEHSTLAMMGTYDDTDPVYYNILNIRMLPEHKLAQIRVTYHDKSGDYGLEIYANNDDVLHTAMRLVIILTPEQFGFLHGYLSSLKLMNR